MDPPLCIHGHSQRLILMCIKNGFSCDCIRRDFITCSLPRFKGIICSVDISRCKYLIQSIKKEMYSHVTHAHTHAHAYTCIHTHMHMRTHAYTRHVCVCSLFHNSHPQVSFALTSVAVAITITHTHAHTHAHPVPV